MREKRTWNTKPRSPQGKKELGSPNQVASMNNFPWGKKDFPFKKKGELAS